MTQRYLVITTDPDTDEQEAFTSDYYNYDNCYNPDYKMIVVDTLNSKINFGTGWRKIEEDHL